MTTTITGTDTHEPILVRGYKSIRRGRNIVHELTGTDADAITLRPAGLRTGTLVALCSTATDALALEADLAAAHTLEFSTDDQTGLDMTFVLDQGGLLVVELDPQTRKFFTVTFDFREIAA
jgi:hypothetical protein